jgi:hypothetical protein
MMLGGVHKGIVVFSTLREIRGLLPLVQEGVVDKVSMSPDCTPYQYFTFAHTYVVPTADRPADSPHLARVYHCRRPSLLLASILRWHAQERGQLLSSYPHK